MPNGDNNRRSYGYTDKPAPKVHRESGSPKPKNSSTKAKKVVKKHPTDWVSIVLFPFRLVGMLLMRVLQLLGWTGKKAFNKNNRKRTFKTVLTLGALGFLGLVILFAWASKDLPDPDKLTDRQVAQSTKIYDRTGEHILYEVFADEKRTLVTLEEIPDYLVNGVIATEDTKFYEHKGIRPLSLLRSVVYGLLGKGRIGGGASTLTQQLVKNAILTSDRTISRKAKEFILAVRLEQKYSKEQILQIYFNEIPYGSTNYGVEAAAQSYFGKSVSDLDLQEAATLAGLPKAPSSYLRNKEALKNRRDFVLSRMFAEGFISEEEMNTAQDIPISIDRTISNIDAPHFVLYVRDKLVEEYGEHVVDTGGLKVITSLDWEKQQMAEEVIAETGSKVLEEAEANNIALVAIEPQTGHILSMVGSKDFYDEDIDGQFNVATLGKRQPGSSFKPIIYAAAFEKGYTPNTILFDVITNFGKNSSRAYEPRNYDLTEHGPVSIRQALQGSLNIPAVKALYLVGDKKGVEFAERLGYSTLGAGNFGLSLVLGGGEVKLIDHVAAYATFANEGVRFEPVSILKVQDNSGEVLFEWKQKKGDRVLEKDITNTLSNVLSDDAARAYAFGAGGILTLGDRPVAVKTGTTNSYVDAWTVGYTPSLAVGVWAGNTNNTPMKRGFGGSRVAAPIWNAFMKKALEGTAVETFPAPPENKTDKAVLNGSTGGGITLKVDKVTGKIATTSTPEAYIVERTFVQPHSILHYVQKDDPQGSVPENPGNDPQYQIWEDSIQDWITRKKEEDPEWDISFEEPPTEYDDLHSLELIPILEVVYPLASSTLQSRQIDTDIRVTAPRGVTKVTYQIDGAFVGVIRNHPFNLNYYAQGIEPGNHTLTIIVEDDVGNRLTEEVPFILSDNVGVEAPSITWVDGSLALSANEFPRSLFLNPFKMEEIDELQVTAEKGSLSLSISTVTDFSNLFNGQVAITWAEAPEKGVWSLIATTYTAGSSSSDTLLVTIN